MRHKMTRISGTCKVILILFIQAGIFFSHVPCARSALSNQAEKLILGFEQSELSRGAHISREEKPGRDSWFYLLERPEGFDFAARFEWPGETNRAWTWHCRQGAHTESELTVSEREIMCADMPNILCIKGTAGKSGQTDSH